LQIVKTGQQYVQHNHCWSRDQNSEERIFDAVVDELGVEVVGEVNAERDLKQQEP
jgi:hypothetical protein